MRLNIRVHCGLIKGLDIRVNTIRIGLEAIGYFDRLSVVEG